MTATNLTGSSSSVTIRLDPPRPAPTGPLDISATARDIVRMSNGSAALASRLLNGYTTGQPQAVRDALERSVAAQLRDNGSLAQISRNSAVAEGQARRHFDEVLTGRPAVPDTTGLTEAQKFDVYASIVEVRGDQTARTDLANAARNGQPTVVALRNETSTLANRGQGVYDDRMVVISRDRDGTPHVSELTGNTEPSAQYDARAGDPRHGVRAQAGYENVDANYYTRGPEAGRRHVDGTYFNGDGVRDLGRLAEGTYHYVEKDGGFLGARAFMVVGNQTAQRDVNGDGAFTRADVGSNGQTTQTGDFRMYIHRGGQGDTWSAGCQTIQDRGSTDYSRFLNAIGANPHFSYVLVNAR